MAASGGALDTDAATPSERDEDEADAVVADGDAAGLASAAATAAGVLGNAPVLDASRVETGVFAAPGGAVLLHPTPLDATHTTLRVFDSTSAPRHRMS